MKKKIIASIVIFLVIYLTTVLFKVPIGNLGYLNLSDCLILVLLTHNSPAYAALIASASTALADVTLGFGQYALYTFLLKAVEGYIIALAHKKNWKYAIVCIILGILIILGYAACDYLLYGNMETVLLSLRFNGLQVIISVIIAIVAEKYLADIKDRYLK